MHLTGQQQLVEDEVGLLEVEDDVKLAHVTVVLVHLLDIAMDNLEGNQLIVGGVAAGDEEERGISAIYDLGVWKNCVSLAKSYPCADPPPTFVLEEVAHARAAGEDELRDVLDDFGLVLGCERGEPLGEALRASAGACTC